MSRLGFFVSAGVALTVAAAVVAWVGAPVHEGVSPSPSLGRFVTAVEQEGAPLRLEARLGHRAVLPGESDVNVLLEVRALERVTGVVARNLVVEVEPAAEGVKLVDVSRSTLGQLVAGARTQVAIRLHVTTKAAPDLMPLAALRVRYFDVAAGRPRHADLNLAIDVTSIPLLAALQRDPEVEARAFELRGAKDPLVMLDRNVDVY